MLTISVSEINQNEEPDFQIELSSQSFGLPTDESTDSKVFVEINKSSSESILTYSISDTSQELGGVLLGNCKEKDGQYHVCVRAVIEARYTESTKGSVTFTHQTWDYINRIRDEKYPQLENEDHVEKSEKVRSSVGRDSVGEKVGKKIIPVAFLSLGLLSGCHGIKTTNECKSAEPLESELSGQTLEDEQGLYEDEISNVEIDKEGKLNLSEKKQKEYTEAEFDYPDYKFELSDAVLEKLVSYEGEYSSYERQRVNHTNWVENFVRALGREDLTRMKGGGPQWGIPGLDVISYAVTEDLLVMIFDEGETMFDIEIDPANNKSVEAALKEINTKFFSEDFEYRVVEAQDWFGNKRFIIRRYLDGVPIVLKPDCTMLLTPDGKVRELMLFLAEFKKTELKFVVSKDFIVQNINNPKHSTEVSFFLNPEAQQRFLPGGYIPSGKEIGEATLDQLEVVLAYQLRSNNITTPILLASGSGNVLIDNKNEDADFKVFMGLPLSEKSSE